MKRFYIIAVVVGLVLFGFLQEYTKVANNHYLQVAQLIDNQQGQGYFFSLQPSARGSAMRDMGKAMSGTHDNFEGFQLFHYFAKRQVQLAKWGFTFLFIVIHFLVINWIIASWFQTHKFRKGILLFYGVVIALSAITFIVGGAQGPGSSSYGFARKLLAALQSTVPLMVIFPACLLYLQQNTAHDPS